MSRRHRSSSPTQRSNRETPRAGHPPRRQHDLGQNDLVDRRAIAAVVEQVVSTTGPIVELAAGAGRLTVPLAALGRPLTAIEIDPRRVVALRARLPSRVRVIEGDLLRKPLPASPHVIVGNLPFHLSTATLRRLLAAEGWTSAALILQWEAARRRAGIGGGSQLTAQSAPWFEFRLVSRIPSTAFRPRPAVDAALLVIERRTQPLVPSRDRAAYQRWVASVFAVPGSACSALARADRLSRRASRARCARAGVDAEKPVSRITAEGWAALWRDSRPR
ncbi:23S ribosomal RNA methyltransferase Erm [Microcella humidisoli]|uniref:23S ribosomal RNA methyltransferase Erm n=1 Tax=Microcella humidisoli TaxID=2963406 RepID=A0ABY5FYL8_9MICO|nr:23S ribosomal RNA methyltransferase Erm [Microcella humidisoli]UTT63420.1 23S ribosomal RNA methyltransferase Erm [Microcella humidisoli]